MTGLFMGHDFEISAISTTHVENIQISGRKRCLISVDAPYNMDNSI